MKLMRILFVISLIGLVACSPAVDTVKVPVEDVEEGVVNTSEEVEVVEEPVMEEVVKPVEEVVPVQPEVVEHVVVVADVFGDEELTIKVGEKVTWVNERDDRPDEFMLIGNRNCRDIRSDILSPGESFSYTFTEAEECVFTDGIRATMGSMKVVVR